MAQIIKVEPGDVLVLANLGTSVEGLDETLSWLKEQLQLRGIIVFVGDVDLSMLPAAWTPDAVAGS